MKTLHTIRKKKTSILVGFVLAMLVAVSSLLFLESGSRRMTAAAVVERGTATSERADRAAVLHESAETSSSRAALPTVVENRMTNEAKEAAKTVKALRTGEASYYGAAFAGRPTANGERFNPSRMTAAHRTLPFGSKLRVTNTRNGRSVVVRVNDRGPYADDRVIDLSRGAAERIGMIQSGTADVKLELIS